MDPGSPDFLTASIRCKSASLSLVNLAKRDAFDFARACPFVTPLGTEAFAFNAIAMDRALESEMRGFFCLNPSMMSASFIAFFFPFESTRVFSIVVVAPFFSFPLSPTFLFSLLDPIFLRTSVTKTLESKQLVPSKNLALFLFAFFKSLLDQA